ncbi:CLUMA_CG000982, isoform A [Clunio marinus]|uniref:CLUMA_CG000982, isoform A n=1 Tax=Clunio marinus TaxID=568069 RepID=A0A1J1HL40_9DIPT|nr:CLUMA_CG000982, isoform A [Clunio marinus]
MIRESLRDNAAPMQALIHASCERNLNIFNSLHSHQDLKLPHNGVNIIPRVSCRAQKLSHFIITAFSISTGDQKNNQAWVFFKDHFISI